MYHNDQIYNLNRLTMNKVEIERTATTQKYIACFIYTKYYKKCFLEKY